MNKKAVMSGWSKVNYNDITRTTIKADISTHAVILLKEFAFNLGISEAKFLELAITSATIGSGNWNSAVKRIERVKKERSYIKLLKRRLIKQQSKQGFEIKPENNELKEVFEKIINDELCGKQLEQLLHSKGLAFASKHINYDEMDGEHEED